MTEIEELQRRIESALDRIAQGTNGLAVASGEDTAALRAELEEEKLANAQLTERVKRLSEKQNAASEEANHATEEARAQLLEMDRELQRLRRANEQLRTANQALREANEAGVGEPHLINKAMLAELEGLRAARSADMAEANQIIARLTPLLNAPVEEESNENA